MVKDHLFVLDAHSVTNNNKPGYCPDCALVQGYLGYYPEVMERIEISILPPPRPRTAIVNLLGEDNQGAPVLVLAPSSKPSAAIAVKTANGHRFINDPQTILNYLGENCGGGMSL